MDGIAIRLLTPSDEDVVRELAAYEGEGDPEALLADPRTVMLVAFEGARPVGLALAHELPPRERGIRAGFVLTDEENVAENALYGSAGGAPHKDVMWEFSYRED